MEQNRAWMYQRLDSDGCLSSIFVEKLEEFIKFASEQDVYQTTNKIKCPCTKCWNAPYLDVDTVKLHLYKQGFRKNYFKWVCHGETFDELPHPDNSYFEVEGNLMQDMVLDAYARMAPSMVEGLVDNEEEPNPQAKRFIELVQAAEKPLYEGCELTLLKCVARVTNLKCEFNLPHRAMDGFVSLMKAMCPDGNEMTTNFYETKRIISGLELPHQRIHVCTNGCMLFWKDAEELEKCTICNAERWFSRKAIGGKKIPKKVLIYFPIGPRLQRLYATKNVVEHMTWHHYHKRTEGIMEHPSDGEAWKHFDSIFPEFASEPHNVRMGLCTDGFAPFAHYGQSYSCWPVLLMPYNLPPWMCMKRQFTFISLLIPGPRNPKGNLDIYLQPLIEELLNLWVTGIMTFDIARKHNFNMKVAVIWTINDFPAYGMLSGWMTVGKLSCPYCMEKAKSFRLKHGRKHSWFDCHRQFLSMDHIFRSNKSAFMKNKEDHSPPPPRLTGDQLWERVSSLQKASHHQGKVTGYGETHNWSRRSIFWDLPYWRKLLIRHNLDMMHIEKNVFEQVINTIMNVKGKSKDDINSRKDLAMYCKRRKLNMHTTTTGVRQREVMPNAPYALSKEQRKVLCEWVCDLKFPDGYASNLGRCVDRTNWWFHKMKSHDCHVFMERLLPIATKELLPGNVWKELTELSQFFRDMCLKKVHVNDVVRLENNIAEIICKIERRFPPSFFNVMEHLIVHLPYELRVSGPQQFRWMYSGERRMGDLKGKVGNKARVESSICNAYLMEEISDFCANYFDESFNTKTRGWGRNVTRSDQCEANANIPSVFSDNVGHASSKGNIRYLKEPEKNKAHAYVLQNCEILKPFERIFEKEMVRLNPQVRIQDVWVRFEDEFPMWFKDYVMSSNDHINDDVIKSLAMGPRADVRTWNHYYINNYNFHTYSYGKDKSTMNYGVCVKGVDEVEYYGILQEVLELTYLGNSRLYKTIIFNCDWFDSINGLNVHQHYKIVDIDHTSTYPKYDPFVLAYQVTQVCFTPYPSLKNDRSQWWTVLKMKPRGTMEAELDNSTPFQEDENDNPSTLAELDMDEELLNDNREEDLVDLTDEGGVGYEDVQEEEEEEEEGEEEDMTQYEDTLEELLENEDE